MLTIRNRLVYLLLVVVIAGGLLPACQSSSTTQEDATPTPIATPIIAAKPTYVVKRGDVVRQIQFTGRVVPVTQLELFFRKEGRIGKVLVKNGDKVTKGQLLAQLESGYNEYDLRRAHISLQMAELSLELTREQITKDSPENAITIKMKELEVERAQINLDELNAEVAGSQIVSEIDGTVIFISISEGTGATAFKPVIIVADLNKMEISVEAKDEELQQLEENMTVSAAPVLRPGEITPGYIRRLPYPYGSSEKSDSQIDETVRIVLEKQPIDIGFRQGDLVQITVTLEEKKDVLWLPPQAVRTFEGRKFVVVQEEGAQRRVDITQGIKQDDRVEIVEGLEEGQVILAP